MDVFAKTIKIDSRSEVVHIYSIGDCHKGAPNHDKAWLDRYVRFIKADKCKKVVILLGDLVDAIALKDPKRFTVDNLSDEVLTGPPATIRRNIANLVVNQAKSIAKTLAPIKEFIIASVRGNHELSIEKSSGIDVHQMICDELGVRNSGDTGIACLTLNRTTQVKIVKIAYMHQASGGRTAGSTVNSLARAMNIFDCEIILQGHNHSAGHLRVVRIGTTTPSAKTDPSITRKDQCAINNGAFLKSYQEGVDSYDQRSLYNPKDEVLYRVSVKIVEVRHTEKSDAPRTSCVIEELHV